MSELKTKYDATRNNTPSQQQHVFASYSITSDTVKNINIPCLFPVKEIRFNFAYSITSSNNNIMIQVNSNAANGEVVGILNKFGQATVAPTWNIRDGLTTSTQYCHIFKDPIQLNGDYTLTFTNLLTPITITSGTVLAHIELLNY